MRRQTRGVEAPCRRVLSVAVVQGGASTEGEVSRASARAVIRALVACDHRAEPVELDARVAEALRSGGYDVVFPVAHGALGEDGSLQGLLEIIGLAYVGSGVLASSLAMHKHVARSLFASAGLPVAKAIVISRGDSSEAAAERARREIGEGLVVKPSSQGSAIGVTRIEPGSPTADVARAIDAVFAIDAFAVVEHFARGREVTCGVLDIDADNPPTALPVTEIHAPNDPYYNYEARYAPGRSIHTCPAELSRESSARVMELAVLAHGALGCRDLSRVDFIVGDGHLAHAITLLEVNTLPGMTDTSLYPEAAAAAGWSMPELCDALVLRAHERGIAPRATPRALPL